MSEPHELSAVAASQALRTGDLTAETLMRSCLERVSERDHEVRAWAHLDHDQALAAARASDAAGNPGPIGGLPVGVKDIINTADMPTRHGSTIHGLNRPNRDAAVVTRTRQAGGIVMGKTVTTEFAWRNPGPTRNPHNTAHTPGGSSSGSAAGTADTQFPLAFGTQTAGSVIRPAAYCGVVGFKPTYGTHDRTGVKELCGSLDTVGTMARSVADIALFEAALRGRDQLDTGAFAERAPSFTTVVPFRSDAAPDALSVFEDAWRAAERAGARVRDQASSVEFERLADVHTVIMLGEAGRALAWEYEYHRERLIRFYRESIATGQAVSDQALDTARGEVDRARRDWQQTLFGDTDLLLTLPAPGEAPADPGFTGDPVFNKLWTMLGWPCVTVPCGAGDTGLPLGLQVVAPWGSDELALAGASWLESRLA